MSLRLRLLLGLGVVAVVLVAMALVVTRSTHADLLDKVDEQLRTASQGIPAGGPGDRSVFDVTAPDGQGGPPGGFPGVDRAPSTLWVGARDDDGSVVTRLGLVDEEGDEVAPDLEADALEDIRPGELATVDGDGVARFRVIARNGSDGVTVLVGTPLDDVDSSVRQLVVVEVVATGLVLALLALVAAWVLRLGVRPIQQMTATATAIGAGDLSQRVPEADPRTEAGELGVALNSMLTHIEDAFAASTASEERLRRFVADASHELRTPITTIRGYAELHRRGGLEDPEARAAAMARTEQEAVRMGALVDDLLLLARLDQGRPLEADPVDLATLVEDARRDATAAHDDHPVTVAAEEGCIVVGDDHRLRQVVANLLGNALRHTPPGTPITLWVAAVPDDSRLVALEVADEGPGLDPDLAERAFERFARGDVARSHAAGSTGLGLSIVEAIVVAHGGEVSLASVQGQGTTVRVVLPGRARSGRPPRVVRVERPLYLHEVVDIVGRGAAPYMAHVVDFDPGAVADRGLALAGTWEVVGTTGRWPQVVNLWEVVDGWDGWTRLTRRTNLAKAANQELAGWWDEAFKSRTGGFDRLLVSAAGAPDPMARAAEGLRGEVAIHEVTRVQPGAGPDYLAAVIDRWAPAAAEAGVHLVGAFEVLMTDVEVCTVWVCDLEAHTHLLRAGVDGPAILPGFAEARRQWCTAWREELMVPGPASPFHPGPGTRT